MFRKPSQRGAVLFLLSICLILVGLLFLPWAYSVSEDESFTGWQLITDFPTNSDLNITRFDITYDAIINFNDGADDFRYIVSFMRISTLPFSPIVLWILVGITVFAIFSLVMSYVVSAQSDLFLNFVVWIAVVGIHGLVIVFFVLSIHPINMLTNENAVKQNLYETFEPERDEIEVEDDIENPVQSIVFENLRFDEPIPKIGLGVWFVGLGMLGLIGQLFFPRKSNSAQSQRSDERNTIPSGMVTSYDAKIRGALFGQYIISVALIFALFPVLFVTLSAFNPEGTISTFSIPQVESPAELFQNFNDLMFNEVNLAINPFWLWLRNSFVVAITSTVLSVLITALSAYSFSRFRFWGRRQLLLGILLIQVFPNLLAMIALYLILQQIGTLPDSIPEMLPFLAWIDWSWLNLFALDSLGGLILVYLGGAMGINTWLMKGFFDSIPRDIDESALVDGATHWQIFWLLIFPLVRPIIAVVGVLSFVGTFNEFVLASILLSDSNETLMVGLFGFINDQFDKNWGMFSAGALISALPVVIIYIALQDQIVGGLTAGSVKG